MSTKYQLYVVNNAPEETLDFCVYQTPPDRENPKVHSLAWLVKKAHPGTTLSFAWTIDYSFTWAQSGVLKPGVVFEASQVFPADPATRYGNQIQFDYKDGAYLFETGTTPQLSSETGSLHIVQSPNIPTDDASVGIGMSGSGTFAIQAEPNMLATFSPHPTYWLTAGTYVQGEVVDIEDISNAQPIEFQGDWFVMTATLDGDNLWTVKPGPPTR